MEQANSNDREVSKDEGKAANEVRTYGNSQQLAHGRSETLEAGLGTPDSSLPHCDQATKEQEVRLSTDTGTGSGQNTPDEGPDSIPQDNATVPELGWPGGLYLRNQLAAKAAAVAASFRKPSQREEVFGSDGSDDTAN